MKKIIRLTESDLARLVKRIIKEDIDLSKEKYGGETHYRGVTGDIHTYGPPTTLNKDYENATELRREMYDLIDAMEWNRAAEIYRVIGGTGVLSNEVHRYLTDMGPFAFKSFERALMNLD